ncbi:MAG TPA: substrate-binding domain-containing protein [Ignavibacteriales bacterium]|nr:substrate-binding domain-containing protein [Ignavibacteriales bacterium]
MSKRHQQKYDSLRNELFDYFKTMQLQPDDQLPEIREILKTELSKAAVNRTLLKFEKEGIIRKKRGQGFFISRVEPKANIKQAALIIPKDFSSHKMFLNILMGIRTVFDNSNVGLLVSISNMNHEKEMETIEMLISKDIDGMIIFLEDNYRENYSHIAELKKNNYPFVLIDRYIPEIETDYVIINNISTMFRICSYLKYENNCNKIIYIQDTDSPNNISSSAEKLEGFKQAVKILYDEDEPVITTLEEFTENIDSYSENNKSLGVCCNHDAIVADVLSRLRINEKEVPANVHLFGYNNSYETPQFPTVEQFNDKVGAAAAEILIEKFNNPEASLKQMRIEPKLILPDGTGNFYQEP